MFDKMKQLMEMKKQADRIKQELDNLIVDSDEGNGVKIKLTGSQNFKSIEVDQSLLGTQNKSQLENHLIRSVNAAIAKSQAEAAQKMKDAMPGGFPGL